VDDDPRELSDEEDEPLVDSLVLDPRPALFVDSPLPDEVDSPLPEFGLLGRVFSDGRPLSGLPELGGRVLFSGLPDPGGRVLPSGLPEPGGRVF